VSLTRDGIAGLVCLAGSLVLLWATRGLPQPALVPIGPGFYPQILLSVTAALSGALVAADLLAGRRGGAAAAGLPGRYGLVVRTFVVFAGYVAAMPLLGFRVATFLFVAALQPVIEPPRTGRRWLLVLAVALATAAVSYLVFERYLTVLLPRGRLTGF
jgi:hypothetical protein